MSLQSSRLASLASRWGLGLNSKGAALPLGLQGFSSSQGTGALALINNMMVMRNSASASPTCWNCTEYVCALFVGGR